MLYPTVPLILTLAPVCPVYDPFLNFKLKNNVILAESLRVQGHQFASTSGDNIEKIWVHRFFPKPKTIAARGVQGDALVKSKALNFFKFFLWV